MYISKFLIITVLAYFMFSCKNRTIRQDERTVKAALDNLIVETVVSGNSDMKGEENHIDFIEEQPLFNGKPAQIGFPDYVIKNVNYQLYNIGGSIFGRVVVEFIVEKDGSISNAKVIRSIDPLLDAEALRLINTSSQWTPAKIQGVPVKVKCILPVDFDLKSDNYKNEKRK